jgi:hypothetical protein
MILYKNTRLKKESITDATIKAYYASNGSTLTLTNPHRLTDGKIVTSTSGIIAGINTSTDFYIDIVFKTPINNIRRLEYISPSNSAYEILGTYQSYIQYLPLTSDITVDTPASQFDDNTEGDGAGTFDDFITIESHLSYRELGNLTMEDNPSISNSTILTILDTPINAKRIRYHFGSRTTSLHTVTEFRVYTDEGVLDFEFNDSVLTTKAWNSSRYNGKQLKAVKGVNRATIDDVGNYGRTPIVQNYSRNIYLGSRVIGLGELTGTDVDDTSLTNFPGFSYVTVNEFLTVHDDLSVTRHSVIGDIEGESTIKKGWYQSWYKDFPIGSDISIKLFDESTETSLRNNYKVFFNGGQLKKMLHIREIDGGDTDSNFTALYTTASHNTYNLPLQSHHEIAGSTNGSEHRFFIQHSTVSTHTPGASFTIFNKEEIVDKFYRNSLLLNPLNTTSTTSGTGITSNVVK